MTNTEPLRHLVIVLPGIMGSVLRHRDGRDVWALSGQALMQFLRTNSASLASLKLAQDDPDVDDLGDGIYADRLIGDIFNIPGLMDGAGYAVLHKRILEGLGGRLIEGSIHAPRDDANFYTFPYDWRRDNRASARKLKAFVETQLPRWRAKSGAADAQVIFMAHSMGGLVSRYYVEKLGGWQYTRQLITFGTPHRGSLNALDVLSNGFRVNAGGVKGALVGLVTWKFPHLFDDLTAMVRSFPSVYQLLPTYRVLQGANGYARVWETDGIPNLPKARAAAAMEDFHRAIINANKENTANEAYSNRTKPIVGVNQNTYQSARLQAGRIEVLLAPPAGLDQDKADGDGTVPRVSAVPVELDTEDREQYLAEHHGWLTNVGAYLDVLPTTLRNLAAKGSEATLGDEKLPPARRIGLALDPLYLAGEAITAEVRLADGGTAPNLQLHVDPVDALAEPVRLKVAFRRGPKASVTLPALPPGLYRAHVAGEDAAGVGAAANTTFEVAE
jgi:hypothetical protein